MRSLRRLTRRGTTLARVAAAAAAAAVMTGGCRSAVVVTPRDPDTQTIVTVEQRPTTNPQDKGLIIEEK